MVEKLKSRKGQSYPTVNVMDISRFFWLVSLGAYSKLGATGSTLFENLVQEGEKFEDHTKKMADERIDEVKNRIEDVKERIIDTWDKLEETFEEQLAVVLNRLGIPTHDDVDELSRRVEALNQSVKELNEV